MGTLAACQFVIVHFPFSNLSQSKLRPAVVLAEAGRGDWLLCKITSKSCGDSRAIQGASRGLRSRLAAHHQLCASRRTIHSTRQPHCREHRRIADGKVFFHSRCSGAIAALLS